MNPPQYKTSFNYSQPPLLTRKIKLGIIVAVVVVILYAGFAILQALRFHVVSTTPSMNSVAAISPYITFNFNRNLSKEGASITSTPSIISSSTIQGRQWRIYLNKILTVGKAYTITIKYVSDIKSDHITNQAFTFTAKNIPSNQLPADQQAYILKQQANQPYTRNSITYVGVDSLLTSGLTLTQSDDFRQACFLFSQAQHTTFKQVAIQSNSITRPPYDSNNPSLVHSMSFNITIDHSSYAAKVTYTGLTDLRLYVYSPVQSGAQVYDSGSIDLRGGS